WWQRGSLLFKRLCDLRSALAQERPQPREVELRKIELEQKAQRAQVEPAPQGNSGQEPATMTALRLPLLDSARRALENCGYCPKLCRSTCPVSNVEAREALIPWAKMSYAWLSARGDLPADRDIARTSW